MNKIIYAGALLLLLSGSVCAEEMTPASLWSTPDVRPNVFNDLEKMRDQAQAIRQTSKKFSPEGREKIEALYLKIAPSANSLIEEMKFCITTKADCTKRIEAECADLHQKVEQLNLEYVYLEKNSESRSYEQSDEGRGVDSFKNGKDMMAMAPLAAAIIPVVADVIIAFVVDARERGEKEIERLIKQLDGLKWPLTEHD